VVLGNERLEKRAAAALLSAATGPTCHRAETTRLSRRTSRSPSPAAIAIGAAGVAFHAAVTAGRLSCPPEVYFGRLASRRRHGLWPFNTVPALFSATAAANHKRQIKTARTAPVVMLRSAEHRPSVLPVTTRSAKTCPGPRSQRRGFSLLAGVAEVSRPLDGASTAA
jgi:hypothetical protein